VGFAPSLAIELGVAPPMGFGFGLRALYMSNSKISRSEICASCEYLAARVFPRMPLPMPSSPHLAVFVLVVAASALTARADAQVGPTPVKVAPRLKVALLPLQALGGVTYDTANAVTEQLAANIQKLGIDTLAPADLQARLGLERQRQLLGCTDTSCLTEIGAAIGVDRVVSGTIAYVGNSTTISLALINNTTGQVETRYSERLKGKNDDGFLDVIPAAVATLFPSFKATQSLEPTASGSPSPTSPAVSGRRVFAWVTAGVGFGALVVGGVALGLNLSAYAALHGQPAPTPDRAMSLVTSGNLAQYVAIGALSAAGALAIGSIILFSMSSSAPAITFAPSPGGATMVLTGRFW
jgi:hypothetical protein